MTGSSGLRRSAVCALVLVPIELIVAACAQHPSVTTTPLAMAAVMPAAAKQQMVGAVDDLTGRLGGDWEQGTGPDYADGAPCRADSRVRSGWTSGRVRRSGTSRRTCPRSRRSGSGRA